MPSAPPLRTGEDHDATLPLRFGLTPIALLPTLYRRHNEGPHCRGFDALTLYRVLPRDSRLPD